MVSSALFAGPFLYPACVCPPGQYTAFQACVVFFLVCLFAYNVTNVMGGSEKDKQRSLWDVLLVYFFSSMVVWGAKTEVFHYILALLM